MPISLRRTQDFNTQFWGLFYRKQQIGWGANGDVYVLGLHEEDGSRFGTRDRELYTPRLPCLP
ncbi:MAG: hypothetical protein M3461_01875 [Pseudomonadota bacterium]|nr:hypothetical protein [Pseudomonadota bacterium]